MRVFAAAAVIALLAGPAYAQQDPHVPKYGEPDKDKTPQQIEADKEAKRAYQEVARQHSRTRVPSDPWGNVRSESCAEARREDRAGEADQNRQHRELGAWNSRQATIKTPTRSPTGTGRAASAGPTASQTQDIVLAPVSDVLIDRAKAKPGERIIDVGCGCGATTIAFAQKVGPAGHVIGIDISAPMLARARQLAPAGAAGRFRARGRNGLSVRSRKLRPSGLALRRDVLRRARALLCQFAQGAAAVGPAGIRLLARAARKPVFHGAAAGGLQARAQTAAARARRPRPVLVCLRGARAPHPGRGRILRHQRWSRAISRSISRSGAASMRRSKPRWKSAPPPARLPSSRRRCAPPPPIRSARR